MNIDSFFSFEDEIPGELEIWQMLLEEARALAETASLDSEKLDEIEAKYLQCISCMRPWDNCTQLDWTKVVVELSRFYANQYRMKEAGLVLSGITSIFERLKWDLESCESWTALIEALLAIGDFEEVDALLQKLRLKQEDFISAKESQVIFEIKGDTETAMPYANLVRDALNADCDGMQSVITKIQDIQSKCTRSEKFINEAYCVVNTVAREFAAASDTLLIPSFDEYRLQKGEKCIAEELGGEPVQEIDLNQLWAQHIGM